MAQRFKVLISAYACEPNKGSEPEVGWQWALQMARFHQVTVLTRANNRPAIESGLARLSPDQPAPSFIYHDLPSFWLQFKRRFNATQLYYLLWQRSARRLIQSLQSTQPFELMHHLTFAAYRYPVATSGHGVPSIWGPVGGIESIPPALLPWKHPPSLARELARNFSNRVQKAPYYLRRQARAATLALASTLEMQQAFSQLGVNAELMPTVGLNPAELPDRPPRPPAGPGPLKLLYVGNIIALKGLDLALRALNQSSTDATFTLAGDGNYLPTLRRLAQRLGLQPRVQFLGRVPRAEVLRLYSQFDVFLFPSLHDTGGYAMLEAMHQQLPVICLDCGGPRLAVKEGSGIKVPLGAPAEVVRGLAQAIAAYDRDRPLIRLHGQGARQTVLRDYDWEKKAPQMDALYRKAVAAFNRPEAL